MKLPKTLEVLDRVFAVRRRKKVVVGKETVRGSFQADKGIEVEKGPEELEILKHEAGHAVFEMSNLAKEWQERLGSDLAEQLEEQVCDRILPLYRDTLKRNGLS